MRCTMRCGPALLAVDGRATYYSARATCCVLPTTYCLPGVLSKRSMAVPKGEHMDAGNMFAAPSTLE